MKEATKQTNRIDGYKNNNSKNQIAIFREKAQQPLLGASINDRTGIWRCCYANIHIGMAISVFKSIGGVIQQTFECFSILKLSNRAYKEIYSYCLFSPVVTKFLTGSCLIYAARQARGFCLRGFTVFVSRTGLII